MEPDVTRSTRLLRAVADGEAAASDELMPLVYDELHHIAGRLLGHDRGRHSLQPTELIHEAYLRLIGDDDEAWEGRVHFTRVAARAMRYVLVDRARSRLRSKRGGGRNKVTLDTRLAAVADDADDILFVHEGLERLAGFEPQLAQIVELKFFGGLTIDEIAKALEVSKSSVDRGWRMARAWWIHELGDDQEKPDG